MIEFTSLSRIPTPVQRECSYSRREAGIYTTALPHQDMFDITVFKHVVMFVSTTTGEMLGLQGYLPPMLVRDAPFEPMPAAPGRTVDRIIIGRLDVPPDLALAASRHHVAFARPDSRPEVIFTQRNLSGVSIGLQGEKIVGFYVGRARRWTGAIG